jgi:hypothetical protein
MTRPKTGSPPTSPHPSQGDGGGGRGATSRPWSCPQCLVCHREPWPYTVDTGPWVTAHSRKRSTDCWAQPPFMNQPSCRVRYPPPPPPPTHTNILPFSTTENIRGTREEVGTGTISSQQMETAASLGTTSASQMSACSQTAQAEVRDKGVARGSRHPQRPDADIRGGGGGQWGQQLMLYIYLSSSNRPSSIVSYPVSAGMIITATSSKENGTPCIWSRLL